MLYYLGLGSNLGNGRENIDKAVTLLGELGHVVAVSSFLESEPWGFVSCHRFTNAVAALQTSFEPMQLLDATQCIERQMGRTHKHSPGEAYTDRIIDIDLLDYDGPAVSNSRLTLPHPLMNQRDFVKIPLAECMETVAENSKNKK